MLSDFPRDTPAVLQHQGAPIVATLSLIARQKGGWDEKKLKMQPLVRASEKPSSRLLTALGGRSVAIFLPKGLQPLHVLWFCLTNVKPTLGLQLRVAILAEPTCFSWGPGREDPWEPWANLQAFPGILR